MSLLSKIMFTFLILLSSCATKKVNYEKEDLLGDLEIKRIESKPHAWTSTMQTDKDFTYMTVCAPTEKEENLPINIRGKCYRSECQRIRNEQVCKTEGEIAVQEYYDMQNEIRAAEELKELETRRKEYSRKCNSGNIKECIEWIYNENSDDYDVLGKLCNKNNKRFSCKTNYEELKVSEFRISCKVLDSKRFSCEEVYDKKYATTEVKYLK